MRVAPDRARIVFERISRQLGRLAKSPSPENVHGFRTASRRLEALMSIVSPETRNQKKLLKLITKLRKKTGKLRDVHVQMALLNSLKLPDRHRLRMLELLAEEHSRRVRKLGKMFDAETLREARKRLRREQSAITLGNVDPLRLAVSSLPKPAPGPLDQRTLHQYRIQAKRARYLAELAGEAPAAKLYIEELRRAQDAIGEWHDVLRLKERAQKLFGDTRSSALVALLDNISRARFRAASHALLETLRTLSREQVKSSEAPGARKGAAFASRPRAVPVGLTGTA
jgi:CHAD domain-containing protein